MGPKTAFSVDSVSVTWHLFHLLSLKICLVFHKELVGSPTPQKRKRKSSQSFSQLLSWSLPYDVQDWHLDLLLESPADPRTILSSPLTPVMKHKPTSYPQGFWGKSKSRNTLLLGMWPSHGASWVMVGPVSHHISNFHVCLSSLTSHPQEFRAVEKQVRTESRCSRASHPLPSLQGQPSITASASQDNDLNRSKNCF